MAKDHYLTYCTISNKKGVILKSFDGLRCLYLENGSVISSGVDFLQMHDKEMNLLWKKNIHTHHLMNSSLDKKHILVMTSTIHKDEKTQTSERFDKLSLYNLKGEELRSFDYYKNQKALNSIVPSELSSVWRNKEIGAFNKVWKVEIERSHANSFYEIDNNKASVKNKAFSKGNYIVNSADNIGTFVLDSKLEKILWHMPIKQSRENEIFHDARVLSSGDISLYHNRSGKNYSEIKLYNPITKKMKSLLKGSPPESFASLECCGSAEILDNGNILSTIYIKGGHVVELNSKGKILWRFPGPHINPQTQTPFPIQGVRLEDLDLFLSNNQGF